MLTLYNVISADGFIARKDGSEDFIPDNLWPNFLNLCRKYGVLIMGRKTYETIQNYEEEPLRQFEELPIKKIVISDNRDFHPKEGYIVAHSPEDALVSAPDALVSSGTTLNDYLLKHRMVEKIILHEVPISIGEGIKPFDREGISLTPINKVPKLKGIRVYEYSVGKVV
ncbi:MAG: hypothetical protein AAB355_00585 [Patescibacteria group bacterium]